MSISKNNKQLHKAKERLQNRELVEITEDNKNEYYEFIDKSINPKPLTRDKKDILKALMGSASSEHIDFNKVGYFYEYDEPCDWDLITNIFQNAIKRKGMTKEEIKEMVDRILDDK